MTEAHDRTLAGRLSAITGAGRGFGAALARCLAVDLVPGTCMATIG